MSKYLLIDIGNSAIKLAAGNGISIRSVKNFLYSKENFEKDFVRVLNSVNNKIKFDIAGISVLDDAKKSIIKNCISKKFKINSHFIHRSTKIPIKINYEKSLGTDRICSAVAAFGCYKGSNEILVIDFGTASTYNFILYGEYKGGMIAPGLLTSMNILNKKASLPGIKIKQFPPLFSGKTNLNINAGVFYQTVFTAEMYVNIMLSKYKNLKVIITGGASNYFSMNSFSFKYEIVSNLVLKGINNILLYNENVR